MYVTGYISSYDEELAGQDFVERDLKSRSGPGGAGGRGAKDLKSRQATWK